MVSFGRPRPVRGLRNLVLLAALVLSVVCGATAPALAAPFIAPLPLLQLPAEARTTYQLIQSGGPFPYIKDGMVFANRERYLPSQARGFYREYTVVTPGSRDRGARRIICGGYKTSKPDVCYYTADHYSTFRRIVK